MAEVSGCTTFYEKQGKLLTQVGLDTMRPGMRAHCSGHLGHHAWSTAHPRGGSGFVLACPQALRLAWTAARARNSSVRCFPKKTKRRACGQARFFPVSRRMRHFAYFHLLLHNEAHSLVRPCILTKLLISSSQRSGRGFGSGKHGLGAKPFNGSGEVHRTVEKKKSFLPWKGGRQNFIRESGCGTAVV